MSKDEKYKEGTREEMGGKGKNRRGATEEGKKERRGRWVLLIPEPVISK